MNEEQSQHFEEMPPIAQMLNGILSDPEKMKKIGAIVGAMSSMPPPPLPTEMTEESLPTAASSAPTGSLGGVDGLSSLLNNPDVLEKLPQILSVMKPLLSFMPPPKPATPKKEPNAQDCRDNLLLALKPFLSTERKEAVDTIIRISKLGNVFQQLK